jgi:hypothetical protein
MSTSDDAWWPSPWPPRNGAFGSSYPNDWTDPLINLRAAGPNPFACAPAPFSAAQLGAMAWHPPIFPGDWSTFSSAPWPQQSNLPAGPTSASDPTAPDWPYPQSILAQLAQFASPASLWSGDTPSGLFSRDPSLPAGGLFGSDPEPTSPFAGRPFSAGGRNAAPPMPGMPGAWSASGWPASLLPPPAGGLFGSDPDPTSPFAGGPFGAGGRVASVPMPGIPSAASTLGLLAPQSLFPPLPQLQSPFAAGGTALDPSNNLFLSGADGSGTPLGRSVLFNRPQPTLDLGSLLLKRERDAATLVSNA